MFVSQAAGNDANPGTNALPKRTIQAGINAAPEGGNVCVDGGTYDESLTLRSFVSIVGGFDRSQGWTRTGAVTAVNGGTTAIQGGVLSNLTITGLTITSANGGAGTAGSVNGQSSYGIRLGFSSGVVITGNTITAGRGGDGFSQPQLPLGIDPPADAGGNGFGGAGGDMLECDCFIFGPCPTPNCPTGGVIHYCKGHCLRTNAAGGSSPCGCTGGSGGAGADSPSKNNGSGAESGGQGATGSGSCAAPGAGGAAGSGDRAAGGQGQLGSSGAPGAQGAGGNQGAPFFFNWSGEHTPIAGQPGASGQCGGGGGGGGGGGPSVADAGQCQFNGAGGGGGGGGGAGGAAGPPGGGGGGSFAIYLFNASATVTNNVLRTTGGGAGGQAQRGRRGGFGGAGGLGGSAPSGQSGSGGNGARGGDGGGGGAGGGGGGGPSAGIACAPWQVFGAVNPVHSRLTESGNTFEPGPGGAGGPVSNVGGNAGLAGEGSRNVIGVYPGVGLLSSCEPN